MGYMRIREVAVDIADVPDVLRIDREPPDRTGPERRLCASQVRELVRTLLLRRHRLP
jgi:hypothetical protein